MEEGGALVLIGPLSILKVSVELSDSWLGIPGLICPSKSEYLTLSFLSGLTDGDVATAASLGYSMCSATESCCCSAVDEGI